MGNVRYYLDSTIKLNLLNKTQDTCFPYDNSYSLTNFGVKKVE